MAILSWLWESILYFFGFEVETDPIDPSSIQIYLRTKNASKIPLVINKEDMTIGDLKAQGILPSQDYEIIFQGRVLSDDVLLRDCDLGNQTVIDTVRKKNISLTEESNINLPKTLAGLQLNSEDRITTVKSKGIFYVFCKECGSLKHAKLRVRCLNCQSGAVILFRDPCSWEDVLLENKISGSCVSCECSNVAAEFYFKCSESFHSKDSTSPPLYLVKSNTRDVPCLSCGEIEDPVIVFECKDRHVLCIGCFQLYGISHLNERSFVLDDDIGYSLGCPIKCGHESLIKETKHFHLLGNDQYERYMRFAAEEFVLKNGGVLCPRPGCGMGIMTKPKDRKVTCNLPEGCGFSFCKHCLNGYHISEECPPMGEDDLLSSPSASLPIHDSDRARSARWDNSQNSLLAIQSTTKPCPNCRTPTERSGGCMHMICTRAGCGLEWCWMCQDVWTRSCMGDHWFG